MQRLEDLAHTARPDLVEDGVFAQLQRLGLAPFDLLPLEVGQLFFFDEGLDELVAIFGIGLGRNEVFQVLGRDDARVFKLLDDLFKR